jgi:regulator of ribosome biosynthesis
MQTHDFSKSVFNLRLPPGNTVFPRSRKIPKKKDKTKWEKFAEEKGIKKQKRSGKLFDE